MIVSANTARLNDLDWLTAWCRVLNDSRIVTMVVNDSGTSHLFVFTLTSVANHKVALQFLRAMAVRRLKDLLILVWHNWVDDILRQSCLFICDVLLILDL